VLDEGGIDALRAMPARGRPARLDAVQRQAPGHALLQSPTAHGGFEGELWTLRRVCVPIQRLHGMEFSQTQVWRIWRQWSIRGRSRYLRRGGKWRLI